MRPRSAAALRAIWSAAACVLLADLPAAVAAAAPPRWTRAHMEAALQERARWRFVYGTRDPAVAPQLRDRARIVAERLFGGDSSWVIADRDADSTVLRGASVMLVGAPRENVWTQRLAGALPVRFGDGSFEWQGTVYARPDESVMLVHPNPLDPERFLILMAGNSRDASAARGGFLFGEDDWRIRRGGELVRWGRFAQSEAAPWRYDAALDRDRDADRARFERSLVRRALPGLEVLQPADAPPWPMAAQAESLLARLARMGLGARPGAPVLRLTCHRSLEAKGEITRDTRPEHVDSSGAHVAAVSGRSAHGLTALAALRLMQRGARESRFVWPTAVWLADRFEGEPLPVSLARLVRAGLLPTAAEAAGREARWRSPLRMTPARALLARAVWETAPPPRRAAALLTLLQREPPGSLDSLCAAAGVAAGEVTRRYAALADTLARRGAPVLAAQAPQAWRTADGFQRGVRLEHAVELSRGYLSRQAADEIAGLASRGADALSLTPFGYVSGAADPRIVPSADAGPDEETDEALVEAAARARLSGMRVWLEPHLWARGAVGDLAYTERGWARFFDEYRECLLHWAILADRERIGGLFLGHGLASSTRLHPARWRALIADTRRVYRGSISYVAHSDEAAHVLFWEDLDLVSVRFDVPLATRPTRDRRTLAAGVRRALQSLRPLSARTGRPVLLAEVAFAPTMAAALRPGTAGDGALDPETQRACYEAVVEGIDRDLWLAGVCWSPWSSAGASAGARDASASPRGRPAEAVMTRALQAWEGRPVRAAQR